MIVKSLYWIAKWVQQVRVVYWSLVVYYDWETLLWLCHVSQSQASNSFSTPNWKTPSLTCKILSIPEECILPSVSSGTCAIDLKQPLWCQRWLLWPQVVLVTSRPQKLAAIVCKHKCARLRLMINLWGGTRKVDPLNEQEKQEGCGLSMSCIKTFIGLETLEECPCSLTLV